MFSEQTELKMLHKRNVNLDEFINIIGVYYLFDEHKNIIYIGASINIGNRIKSHKKGKSKPYKPFKYFAFTETSKEDLFKTEAIEINKNLPKYNIVVPYIKKKSIPCEKLKTMVFDDNNLKSTEKLIMLCLVFNCKKNNICEIPLSQISKITKLTKVCVINCIKRLVEKNVLITIKNENLISSNSYILYPHNN